MNHVLSLLNREKGVANDVSYDFALRRLCVAKEDSWRGITPSNYSSDFNPEPPIFSAKFANCDGYRHILAIANEDGKIALQDTTKRNYDPEEKAMNAPQCHYNAVFDLEWAPGQMKFVSASGDHTARLWEVDGSEIRSARIFNGHTRSVKTAAFRKCDPSVFATGGRDGAIIIWDTRANLNVDLTSRADNCIFSGHSGGPGTPVSQKKRSRTPKLHPPVTSSSITGLVFQDSTTLISCGAGDGVIKVWDMRRNYSSYKKEPLPKYSLPYAGSSTFKGFTNLLIDDAGAKLYANCMDNTIYCYNLFSYSTNPLAIYTGFRNNTFYIKSCLSPDGKYLISGSSDEKAYIWNLNNQEPLVALSGHTVEVTCVAWGATHDRPIVTCSDDARHKIWRIGPEHIDMTDKMNFRGQAEFFRTYNTKPTGSTHKYNLRDLESTPRSLKRIVEQNEKTPGSADKISTKRSFIEMMGCTDGDGRTIGASFSACQAAEGSEPKRPKTIETRGRRLFSPTTSTQSRCLNFHFTPIPEERTSPVRNHPDDSNQENTLTAEDAQHMEADHPVTLASSSNSITTSVTGKLISPLSERIQDNQIYTSPPVPSLSSNFAATTSSASSVIFSPTSNLPNYVLDGDAPHLSIMSPKRKHKDKVDWLTKIRKQKLMTSCRSATLSDKINDERSAGIVHTNNNDSNCISSPRLQSLRDSEGSPRTSTTPRRRMSRAGSLNGEPTSPCSSIHQLNHNHHSHNNYTQKTPTSKRRRSETSILRFFTIQQQQRKSNCEEMMTSSAASATQENINEQPHEDKTETSTSSSVRIPSQMVNTTATART